MYKNLSTKYYQENKERLENIKMFWSCKFTLEKVLRKLKPYYKNGQQDYKIWSHWNFIDIKVPFR